MSSNPLTIHNKKRIKQFELSLYIHDVPKYVINNIQYIYIYNIVVYIKFYQLLYQLVLIINLVSFTMIYKVEHVEL